MKLKKENNNPQFLFLFFLRGEDITVQRNYTWAYDMYAIVLP